MRALSVCVLQQFLRVISSLRYSLAFWLRARTALAVIAITGGLGIPISSAVANPLEKAELEVAIFVVEVGEDARVTTRIVLEDPSNMEKDLQALLARTADQAQNTTKVILFGTPEGGGHVVVTNGYLHSLPPESDTPIVNLQNFGFKANKSAAHFFVGDLSNEQSAILAEKLSACCSQFGSISRDQNLDAHDLYIKNLQSTFDKFKWPAGFSTVGGVVIAGCSAPNLICQQMTIKAINSVLSAKHGGQ